MLPVQGSRGSGDDVKRAKGEVSVVDLPSNTGVYWESLVLMMMFVGVYHFEILNCMVNLKLIKEPLPHHSGVGEADIYTFERFVSFNKSNSLAIQLDFASACAYSGGKNSAQSPVGQSPRATATTTTSTVRQAPSSSSSPLHHQVPTPRIPGLCPA